MTIAFGLTLAAAFALPLISIWSEFFRAIAFAVLLNRARERRTSDDIRWWLPALLAGLAYLIFLLAVAADFLASPLQSFIDHLRLVNGVPRDWLWSILRLLVDAFLVMGLMRQVWHGARIEGRLLAGVVLGCLAAMLVLPHVHLLWSGVDAALEGRAFLETGVVANLEKEMAGIAGWTVWILTALLALALLHESERQATVLACVFYAGVIQAAVILAQHVAQDFSYVVDSPQWSDRIFRARGTYFYHSAAGLFLILAFFLGIGARAAIRNPTAYAAGLAAMMLAIYLNGTRALALGMIAGAVTFAIMRAGRPVRWRETILALGLAAAFVPEVFVIKFQLPEALRPGSEQAAIEQPESEQSDVGRLAQSNQPRIDLLRNGLAAVWASPVLGQGVGTLTIEVSTEKFGGLVEADSSHALPVDIVLMAGIPVLLALGLLIATISAREVRRSNAVTGSGPHGLLNAGMMACLAAFVVTSMFFPRESNFTIILIFLIIALSVSTVSRQWGEAAWNVGPPRKSFILGVGTVGLSAIGWAVMTSSTGVFPVAELVAHHMRDPLAPTAGTVYANSRRLELLSRAAFHATGMDGWEAALLVDDPDALPRNDGWVLWDPSRDQAYSALRETLGHDPSHGWRRSPSFVFPDEWRTIRAMQPVVSIIQVGPQPFPPIPALELGTIDGGVAETAGAGNRYEGDHRGDGGERLPLEGRCSSQWVFSAKSPYAPGIIGFQLAIEGADGTARIRTDAVDVTGRTETSTTQVTIQDGEAGVRSEISEYNLASFHVCIESAVEVRELDLSFFHHYSPDVARTAAIWHEGRSNATVIWLTDGNHGSVWTGEGGSAALIFGPRQQSGVLSAYRLSGAPRRSDQTEDRLDWWLEGSDDGATWRLMDKRIGMTLPFGRREFATFVPESPGSFSLYRLRLRRSQNEVESEVRISEVELYTAR